MIDRGFPHAVALALAAAMASQTACGGNGSSGTASRASAAATSASSGGSNGSSASPAVASNGSQTTGVGEQPPDFPTQDPNRWVNGQPFTLASAHGDVVLVESWHRL